jgi:hypothetical protein
MKTRWLLLCLPVILFSCRMSAFPFFHEKGMVLWDAKTPPCPVLIATNASPGEKLAAQKLTNYLGRLSGGAVFPIQPATNPPARAIQAVINPALSPNPEAYAVRMTNGGVVIEGAALRGLQYGIYAFLEQGLGCRWWSIGEEDVPVKKKLTVSFNPISGSPAMPFHCILSAEAQRMINDFPLKRRTVSPEQFDGSHTLCPYLKAAGDANTEFFPMNKAGKREFNNLHMCYTAPGMAEALADAMARRIEATGRDVTNTIYMAGMGDWYGGMCECERCKKIYGEEAWTDPDGTVKPAYAATLLRMINRTAEILEGRYPGVRIGTAAYMSLEAPPAKTTPRQNVHIWMPHLRHCIVHGIDECAKNRNFYLNLRRWLEIAPNRVSIWDYGVNFDNFMAAFPTLRSMSRNIRLYHEWGVHGVMIQGNYVSTGGDLVVLKNDVWSRLLWDPSLDPMTLTESFCTGYYGPAAKDMLAYINLLEDSVTQPAMVHLDEFDTTLTNKYLKPELMARLNACLDRALKRARGQEPYERRVREARVGVESVILFTEGPVREEGDRLVRTDIPNSRDRILELVANCREASPREWGTGRSYRLGSIMQHGGPLVTLTRGPLTVKVAPIQGGRLRRLIYNGTDLLHVPDFARKEPAYTAGAWERLEPGAALYEITNAPTATAVSMTAELGIGHWSPNTKQLALKTVELTGDHTVRITGTVHRVARDESDRQKPTLITEYAVTNIAGVVVEGRNGDGPWAPLPIVAGKPDPKNPAPATGPLSAFRITLPGSRVIVTDTCKAPAATGGRVWHEPARGALVVELSLEQLAVAPQGETLYMDRELDIQPMP